MSVAEPLPILAIVGRPNVGKSTLFNRLCGQRRAIVEDQPGITRDRIYEVVEIGDRRFLLVDTAGLEGDPRNDLDTAVQRQVRVALDEADAILFVVDGQAGLLPEDETIARELRRGDRPVALIVNKIDDPRHETRLAEFHRLGFEPLWAVSAEHGRGAWDALDAVADALPAPDIPVGAPAPPVRSESEADIGVALVGRPNVGKSSLLNRLTGRTRAVVSAEGGTTRDAIDTTVEEGGQVFHLVDTAGLRKPGRRDRTGERVSALLALRAIERAEVALAVFDASEGPTDQDLHVIRTAWERGRAVGVLLNKYDLVKGGNSAHALRESVARALRFAPDIPVLAVSAKTGAGVGRSFDLVRRLSRAARYRVPTAALNRWLRESVAAHEPAMAQRGTRKRPLRFFYATQVGVRPPSVVLFCTDPRGVRTSYLRYLENRFRAAFPVAGSPVRLLLRARREPA